MVAELSAARKDQDLFLKGFRCAEEPNRLTCPNEIAFIRDHIPGEIGKLYAKFGRLNFQVTEKNGVGAFLRRAENNSEFSYSRASRHSNRHKTPKADRVSHTL